MAAYEITIIGPKGGVVSQYTRYSPSSREALIDVNAPPGGFVDIARKDELTDFRIHVACGGRKLKPEND